MVFICSCISKWWCVCERIFCKIVCDWGVSEHVRGWVAAFAWTFCKCRWIYRASRILFLNHVWLLVLLTLGVGSALKWAVVAWTMDKVIKMDQKEQKSAKYLWKNFNLAINEGKVENKMKKIKLKSLLETYSWNIGEKYQKMKKKIFEKTSKKILNFF